MSRIHLRTDPYGRACWDLVCLRHECTLAWPLLGSIPIMGPTSDTIVERNCWLFPPSKEESLVCSERENLSITSSITKSGEEPELCRFRKEVLPHFALYPGKEGRKGSNSEDKVCHAS
jgi:hypothetical protein